MVFKNGKIVGHGEHEELKPLNEHYKEIVEKPNPA